MHPLFSLFWPASGGRKVSNFLPLSMPAQKTTKAKAAKNSAAKKSSGKASKKMTGKEKNLKKDKNLKIIQKLKNQMWCTFILLFWI